MSAVASTVSNVGLPPTPVRKLSVDEYHSLIQAGHFKEDERFELLEGWVVPKMSRNPPHDTCIELTQAALLAAIVTGWRLRIQSAVTTGDSEPEPDLAIVRGPIRAPAGRHPIPSEVGLLIEVADTSLESDRNLKSRVYARAGVPVYWIINLVDRVVEIYTEPSGPSGLPVFANRTVYAASDLLPLILTGVEVARIAVAELLP